MPNPKVGTVTMDVATAVKNAKAGQVQYRTDKAGIIHCTIGRARSASSAAAEPESALLDALQKACRPRPRAISEEGFAPARWGRGCPRRSGQPDRRTA